MSEIARGGIGHCDHVVLEHVSEELLGRVLCLLRTLSAVPDIRVNGVPVSLAEARQRLSSLGRAAAAGRDDTTPLRGWKPARGVTAGL